MRDLDREIRDLYIAFEAQKERSGKPLSADDAALQLALARHPACAVSEGHSKAALSSIEADRTPKPSIPHDGSPRQHPDYAQLFCLQAVSLDAEGRYHFHGTGRDRAYNYTEAILEADRLASNPDRPARPVAVMGVIDIYLPPERPAVHRYRIRRS